MSAAEESHRHFVCKFCGYRSIALLEDDGSVSPHVAYWNGEWMGHVRTAHPEVVLIGPDGKLLDSWGDGLEIGACTGHGTQN